MKIRFTLLLGMGITGLLTALLFLPIPITTGKSEPMHQSKAATISLVDRIAVEQPTKETLPKNEAIPAEEILNPLSIPEETSNKIRSEQADINESTIRQAEEQAATVVADEAKPVLIDGYYTAESVTTPPVFDRALLASRIVYPPLAKRQRKEGLVILRLFLAPNGMVERIVVEEDPGYGLADAAIAAFTSFKASPALYKDEAVAVTLRYPIRFSLQ
jgi:TonB family C-terminal domain